MTATGQYESIFAGGYEPSGAEIEPFRPEIYRYYLADLSTDKLLAELPVNDVTWGRRVSAAGDFSGTVPASPQVPGGDLYDVTTPGRTGVYVTRGEETVFGGVIWERDYSIENRALTIAASGFESYLYRRHIAANLVYSNDTDQYDVVRDLIHRMQNDFAGLASPEWVHFERAPEVAGIGLGVVPGLSGHKQDTQVIEAHDLKSVGEFIEEFANNLWGFEWNIECSWNGALNRFEKTLVFRETPPSQLPRDVPFRGTRTGLETNLFEFPGNIISAGMPESASNACTRQFVAGGQREGQDGRVVGSWVNREEASTGHPLIDLVESSMHSSVLLVDTVNKYAEVYGRRNAPPSTKWSVTVNGAMDPVIGTYRPGDWCRLNVNDEYASRVLKTEGEAVKRITGYSVSVPTVPQKPETVTLELQDEWGE